MIERLVIKSKEIEPFVCENCMSDKRKGFKLKLRQIDYSFYICDDCLDGSGFRTNQGGS